MAKKTTIIPIALMAVLAASCSGGGGGGSGSSASGEAVKVTFQHTFGQALQKIAAQKADEFEELILENTGVTVDVEVSNVTGTNYDSIHSQIITSFSSNSTPTIAVAYPDHVADYLAQEPEDGQYVADISEYVTDPEIGLGKQSYLGDPEGDDGSDFVDAFWEEGATYSKEGRYSMPFLKSSEAMFYNEDAVLRACAISTDYAEVDSSEEAKTMLDSMSWSEFMDFCRFIKENEDQILPGLTEVVSYDSDANLFISHMFQKEIPYASIDSEGNGVVDFESGDNRAAAEAMVTEFKTLYDDGILATKGTIGNYGSEHFKNKQSVFQISSTGGAGYNTPSSSEVFTEGVVKVPTDESDPENKNLYVNQGPSITFLKNQALTEEQNEQRIRYAWQFVKFLTNPSNNVECCLRSEGYCPVRESAYEDDRYLELVSEEGNAVSESCRIFSDELTDKFFVQKVFKGSAALREQCGGIITNVLKQGTDVTAAFDTAINQAKTYM
jgi:multiple sugar transport system substrate-binding protein